MENAQDTSRPEQTIAGVVDPTGASAGQSRGQTDWTLRFTFESWRGADGQLRRTKLKVRRVLKESERASFMQQVRACEVVHARVRFVDASTAELVAIVTAQTSDAALLEIAAELRRPIVESDEVFGELTFDRRLEWYEGSASWRGKQVKLRITPSSDGPGSALLVAKKLWADQDLWDRRSRACAVDRLLKLKNEKWLSDDDEGPVAADAFADRMVLKSVKVDADGEIELWYDDGDLFWGHSIIVSGSLDAGLTDATIAG